MTRFTQTSKSVPAARSNAAAVRRFPERVPAGSGARGAFTLTELLVVLGIIAIFAALLFPFFSKATASSKSAKCLSNLHLIGVLINTYAAEHNGCLPHNSYSENPSRWYLMLNPYFGRDASDWRAVGSPFVCPANFGYYPNDKWAIWSDYGYLCNWLLMPRIDSGLASQPVRLANISKRRILVSDTVKGKDKILWINVGNKEDSVAPFGYSGYPDDDPRLWVHNKGINALWTDFSASYISISEVNVEGSKIPGGAYYGKGN